MAYVDPFDRICLGIGGLSTPATTARKSFRNSSRIAACACRLLNINTLGIVGPEAGERGGAGSRLPSVEAR